jgi:TonB family protein
MPPSPARPRTLAPPRSAAQRRRLRGLLAVVAVGWAGLPASGAEPGAARVRLDIPSQPLDLALVALANATRLQVMCDGAVTAGRRSAAVRGELAPEDALRAMLGGTGLAAVPLAPGAFTLEPAPAAVPAASAAPLAESPLARERSDAPLPPTLAPYRAYFGAVQQRVLDALCAQPALRPGGYELELAIGVAPEGGPLEVEVTESSGDPRRDQAVVETVRALSMPPPPAEAPPSFLLGVVRRAQDGRDPCAPPAEGPLAPSAPPAGEPPTPSASQR